MTMPDQRRMVEVLWLDSTGHDGWTEPEVLAELARSIECRSAGIVVDESDAYLTIALGVGGLGQFLAPMCIPRSAIIDVVDVEPQNRAMTVDDV